MNDDQRALADFDGEVKLFPLPGLVLFPQILQGLHIFEPRYRQLTADALAGDQLFAIVLVEPHAPTEDDPVIATVACLCRITHHEKFPDGRYNLRAKGIARIKIIEELPSESGYRVARAELVLDVSPADSGKLSQIRRQLAEAVLPRFEPDTPAFQHLSELFRSDTPLGALCDMLAYALPLEIDLKQQLLEEVHVATRAEILIHAVRPPTPTADRPFPPEFSRN